MAYNGFNIMDFLNLYIGGACSSLNITVSNVTRAKMIMVIMNVNSEATCGSD